MEAKRLSRRAFLKAAGVGAAGALVAACAPMAPSTAPGAEAPQQTTAKKKVRMYAQGLTPRERLETDRWDPPQKMWDMEKAYEEAHPDVDIEFIPQIPTGYEEWLVTQMSGGTSPEIVWYQRGYIARDYQKGWFVNLDPYLEQPNPYVDGNKRWIDIFQPPVIASGTAPDGHIYMITGDIVGTGFFYNKNMFEEIGADVPETWAEYEQVQQALKEAGHIPMSISMDLAGGVQLYGSWSTREVQDVMYDRKMGYIKWGEEGANKTVSRTWKPGENLPPPVMVRAIKAGRYGAKDPEWKEMLRIIKGWSNYWPDGFWAVPPDDVYRLWATGEAAVAWMGSWMNKPVRNDPLIEFEWGIFPKIPKITEETSEFGGVDFPAMAGVGGVFQYAIASVAEERGVLDETIDWMRFITAPKNLIALLNDHGGFAPGTVDTTGADPTLSVYTDMMVKYGTERIEPFDSMLTREFVDTLWNLLQQFLADQIDAEQMTDQVQQEMERAADQLLAEHPDWAEGS
ncbi:MAG: carbohydrate ABC transporter substrate-binding protein [Chloroflexi bacterium]|nr:carbohydrate ABC transporter substrate-binding protein [Chloroflexota bacterium]